MKLITKLTLRFNLIN